jgi:hypothetical protein
MKPVIDGEVWAIETKPIHANPGSDLEHSNYEFYRVKDIFSYSSSQQLMNNKPGAFIPRDMLAVDETTDTWVQDNKLKIIEYQLPIVRRNQGTWTIDLGLVNRL